MIVVIAEKPSVARDLARVLGARTKRKGFLEGNGYAVTWAFGHLVELVDPEKYDAALKSWKLDTLPIIPEKFRLQVGAGKGVKEQFTIIKKLCKEADSLICATDAGREGELIFRYIQQHCGCKSKPAQRLWISSLTDAAIRSGFQNLRPLAEYDNLAAAATCRSQADWIVGLNATRGYTVKHAHGRGVLSVGRVQTPVLALIVKRDQLIRNFKPEDYWELWTLFEGARFKHVKDAIKVKEEAEALLEKVQGAPFGITKVEEKSSSQPPPQLFDLTELQRTMNKSSGFSAARTLQIAQSLYEKKCISYPRTDSRYLTEDLYPQCGQILGKLAPHYGSEVGALDLQRLSRSKRFFNNAKVTDHHAIIPTGQFAQLDQDEKRVLHAISLRFIAAFFPNCLKNHTTVHGEAAAEKFRAKGTRIVSPGWLALYRSEKKEGDEQELPAFTAGHQGPHKPEVKACRTKPPAHYTEATLLSAMESAGKTVDDEELREAMKERGLGTPATRASIIETLLKREYIRKEKKTLLATDKGEDIIALLSSQATLTSPEMTAEWEYRLKQIERGQYRASDFMEQVRKFTEHIVGQLRKPSSDGTLGRCPLCSQPVIKGNVGYGCSAWKQGCPFRFHAQQFGTTLSDQDVSMLLHRGRLSHPRKLVEQDGSQVSGYVTLDSSGQLGILSREEKLDAEALGACPQCNSSVIEKFKCYACTQCPFVIWKTIARKKISTALTRLLLSKGRSRVLKGFRSKAGKPFSAALVLKEGKVEFEFPGKQVERSAKQMKNAPLPWDE